MQKDIDLKEDVRLRVGPELPQELDAKYEVLDLLGQGGMASVYKARHKLTEQLVAIKILHDQNENSLKRFKQEASLAVRLSHPNIVRVHDFDIMNHVAFIVMEYVEGRTLAQAIASSKSIGDARFDTIARDICEGLAHAHNLGIVHRDIKPSNIMLTKIGDREVAKIADFGVARSLTDQNQGLTATGEIMGTPLYMSPEQCTGQPATAQSDIYAVGCVLYEMLFGKPPLAGSNFLETTHLRATQDVEIKLTSPAIQHTLEKCLARDPLQRFQSTREIVHSLNGTHQQPATNNTGRLLMLILAGLILAGSSIAFFVSRNDKAETPPVPQAAKNWEQPNQVGWRAHEAESLAETQIAQGRFDEARPNIEESRVLWNRYGNGNAYSVYGYLRAAEMYLKIGEPQMAVEYTNVGYGILKNLPREQTFRTERTRITALYEQLVQKGLIDSNLVQTNLDQLAD
jgi:serine/threonine protein kinase